MMKRTVVESGLVTELKDSLSLLVKGKNLKVYDFRVNKFLVTPLDGSEIQRRYSMYSTYEICNVVSPAFPTGCTQIQFKKHTNGIFNEIGQIVR